MGVRLKNKQLFYGGEIETADHHAILHWQGGLWLLKPVSSICSLVIRLLEFMQAVTTQNQVTGDIFVACHLRLQVILQIFLNSASISLYPLAV